MASNNERFSDSLLGNDTPQAGRSFKRREPRDCPPAFSKRGQRTQDTKASNKKRFDDAKPWNHVPQDYYPPIRGHHSDYPVHQPVTNQTGHPSAGAQVAQDNTPWRSAVIGCTYNYLPDPALVICQHCQATVTTSLRYEVGLKTWFAASCLLMLCGYLGCCLVPFVMNSLKDVVHRCPRCGKIVGKYNRS